MKRSAKLGLAAVLVLSHAAVFIAAMQGPAGGKSGSAESLGGEELRQSKSAPRGSGGLSYAQLYEKLMREPGLSDEERRRSREKLLVEWARHDMGAVLDQMWGPRPKLKLGAYANDELTAEMVKQKEQIWEWIRSGRFGSKRQYAFSYWFTAMRNGGQGAFVLASLPQATKLEKPWALQALCDQADASLLKDIRAVLQGWDKGDSGLESLMQSYARRQALLAAGNTQLLFQGETDPGMRDQLGAAWLEKRVGWPPPVDRFNEIMELPEDARGQVVSNLINNFDDHGMAGFGPALLELNRLGLWKELSGKAGQESVRYLAMKKSTSPHEILGTLAGINDAQARAVLLEEAGLGMGGGEKGAQALAEVMELFPAGPDRDACLVGMVKAQVSSKKDLAKENLGRISDAAKREELLKNYTGLRE